ncbi:yrdC domain-containing protein, mitochondrial-like [Gigantopelta aegis]|uniref:yrdC domain-containing protein, mitochondrial-like n=1 Tax=Gigantopelta aegis TaxID=1735272 RepID=UPI001B8896CA|nr:yrdC domain-containing protein, mitochondrial-like [Gigantopelta aegis]
MKWHVVCKQFSNFTVISKYSFPFSVAAKMNRGRIISLHPECVDVNEPRSDGFVSKLAEAVSSLKAGNVIALPTDTIYGIAGLAQNSEAVNQIYHIKNRDLSNPIAVCVGRIQDVYKWSKVTISESLLSELLPGPVTVVLRRGEELNPDLNPGVSLVGIRIPDHTFVRACALSCNEPLVLTSANLSTTPSTVAIQEFQHLWPKLDLIFDGGTLPKTEKQRLGSTVVDLSVPGKYRVIRKGSAYENTMNKLMHHKLEEIVTEQNSR